MSYNIKLINSYIPVLEKKYFHIMHMTKKEQKQRLIKHKLERYKDIYSNVNKHLDDVVLEQPKRNDKRIKKTK